MCVLYEQDVWFYYNKKSRGSEIAVWWYDGIGGYKDLEAVTLTFKAAIWWFWQVLANSFTAIAIVSSFAAASAYISTVAYARDAHGL